MCVYRWSSYNEAIGFPSILPVPRGCPGGWGMCGHAPQLAAALASGCQVSALRPTLDCPCLYLHTESSRDPSAAHLSVSSSDLSHEPQTLSPSLVLPTLDPISHSLHCPKSSKSSWTSCYSFFMQYIAKSLVLPLKQLSNPTISRPSMATTLVQPSSTPTYSLLTRLPASTPAPNNLFRPQGRQKDLFKP